MCARGSRWGGALPEAPACARPADVWRRPRPGQAWPLGDRAWTWGAERSRALRFAERRPVSSGPRAGVLGLTALPLPRRRPGPLSPPFRVRSPGGGTSCGGISVCPADGRLPPDQPGVSTARRTRPQCLPPPPAGWPAPKAAGYAGWPAGRCWGHTPRPQPGCLGRSFPTSYPCVQVSGGEGVAGMTTPTPTSCPPWPPQRPDGSQTGSASAPEQDGDREPPDTAGRGTWPGSCPPHAPCVDAPSPRTARPRLRGGLVWNVLCRTPGF